jgi:aryl-alcohol dehydrogenase-like predicted oxidoreductase
MGFLSEWEAKKGEWEPKLKKIQQLAKEKLNCSLAQLSIAWVVKNKDISTAILGAKKPEQLNENLKALEIVPKLTKDILEEIEKIMENAPKGEIDYFNNFAPLPIRRDAQK